MIVKKTNKMVVDKQKAGMWLC